MWMLHNLRECFNHPDEWHAFVVGAAMCSPNRFFNEKDFADLIHKKWYYYAGRLLFYFWMTVWISCLVFAVTCVISGV